MSRDYSFHLLCAATLAGVVIACLDSNAAPAADTAVSPIVAVQEVAPTVAPAATIQVTPVRPEKSSRHEQRLAHRAARRALERSNAAAATSPAKMS